MAIEYLYDCIRATAGNEIPITAVITDDNGDIITEGCGLMLHNDTEMIAKINGVYINDEWCFTIPAEATKNLSGRFWYCICHNDANLCFKQPIYLM